MCSTSSLLILIPSFQKGDLITVASAFLGMTATRELPKTEMRRLSSFFKGVYVKMQLSSRLMWDEGKKIISLVEAGGLQTFQKDGVTMTVAVRCHYSCTM